MWLTSVCVSLYVYLSLTAAHNITFFSPHSTELSESAVVMEKTDGSNGMQHPRIIPIMLNWLWAGEQQQQQHKQNWTWHPQLVMNHNLIELLFMSMSVYTCICIYIRPVGTYTFTYICNGRYVIVCVLLTCCVIAKPMTGSPSGMSHVTTAEFAFTALMVTLTGGDKLSADTQRERERETKSLFYLLPNEPNEKISSFVFLPERRYCHQNGRKPSSAVWVNGSAESIMKGGSSGRVQTHKTIPQCYSGCAQGLAWSCRIRSVSPFMKLNL